MRKDAKISELKELYKEKESIISRRVAEFRRLWESGDEIDYLKELIFCILTPQSKAKICWQKVLELFEEKLIFRGGVEDIASVLTGVRFRFNKAYYIILAHEKFIVDGKIILREKIKQFGRPLQAREWLVKNIKGMGYKEASHFLRNIGFGENLAILDRHILKNLNHFGVISEIPKSLTRKKYLGIEEKFLSFAEIINIPPSHLDLLLWCKETGEVFK